MKKRRWYINHDSVLIKLMAGHSSDFIFSLNSVFTQGRLIISANYPLRRTAYKRESRTQKRS